MSIFKVRRSSLLRLKSVAVLSPVFEFVGERVAHFRQPNRRRSTNVGVITSPHADIRAPCSSLSEFIWKDVNKWCRHTAICSAETGKKYTYEDLRKLCRRFAVALRQKNFQKGDILSIILPNTPEYVIVLLGTIEAGLVATTLNPMFTAEEISRQLQNSQSSVIVTLSSLTELVYSAKKLIETRTNKPFPLALITLDGDGTASAASTRFDEMLDARHDNVELDVQITGEDLALMPYSSGTTGFPKGVQLTHSNLVHNLLQICSGEMKHVEETSGDYQEVVPAVLPFFHIFGISAMIFTSLMYGCKIISLSKFKPDTFAKLIVDEKATILYLVPTLSFFLTSHPSIKPGHLNRIRLSFFAGGSTPVTEVQRIVELGERKMTIVHGYGLTEASPAVCAMISDTGCSSVGPPLASTCIKVIGFDGTAQSSYQRGEICVKGPQVMKGYFNNPEATKDVIDADGFLHTGDVGYYADDKCVYYVDRMKELIKVKGFQVPPVELESVVKSYEGVKDVGVIGVPDSRCGEIPVAFVVPKLPQEIREKDLKRFVAEKVAPYKQLGRVILAESIPRNPSGKILRRILREKYENLS